MRTENQEALDQSLYNAFKRQENCDRMTECVRIISAQKLVFEYIFFCLFIYLIGRIEMAFSFQLPSADIN